MKKVKRYGLMRLEDSERSRRRSVGDSKRGGDQVASFSLRI